MIASFSHLRAVAGLDGKTFLVCIGAMKCATSWVHHYLSTLSGMTVSPLKELHFFDAKFSSHALGDMEAFAVKRVGLHMERAGNPAETLMLSPDFQASVDRMQMIYDDNAYFAHFARLATSETAAFADVTPAYSVLGPEGFAYMRDFFAKQNVRLKILYILRDPVDRLWSQLRHLEEINPKGEMISNWPRALQSPPIMARADYAGTFADLDMAFAREDVLTLFYEDLFSEQTLRRLGDFASVDFRPADTQTRRNRTKLEAKLPEDARAAFLETLKGQYAFCRDRFGDQIPDQWLA